VRHRSGIVVFCGPTISAVEVSARLPGAIPLPPVEQGDVLRATVRRPRAIAIIDGYFDQVPAVWHKEILWAMKEGIHVFGSSSMGALRAAELHQFGMIGVGAVFEAYRSGELTDDDEVAVAHGPPDSGYRAISTAMVDLRDRFTRAAAAGAIPASVADQLCAIAKGLWYPDRTLHAVLAGAADVIEDRHVTAIRKFVDEDALGLKARDAHALLDRLSEFSVADPPAFKVDYEVPRTLFFDALYNEVDRVMATRDDRAEFDPEVVLWTGETMPVVRKQQLLRVLSRREAERIGIQLTPEEVSQTVNGFRHRYGLTDDDETQRWLSEADLSWAQFVEAMAEMTMVEKMERVYSVEVDAALHRLIKLAQARARIAPPTKPAAADG
jgi:hypothetical protein